MLLRSNFSPFPQYFQHIFLTKVVKLHVHLYNLVVRLVFSKILHIRYVEVRISRSVSEGPFDFEITRVDCICKVSCMLQIKGLRNNIKSVKHIIKSMKQKYSPNTFMGDATKTILPICKCLQSSMTVNNTCIGTG